MRKKYRSKKYVVTAQTVERKSGQPIGKPRKETIDIGLDDLFNHANNAADLKLAYESFWNDTNPHSFEIVRVLFVKKKKQPVRMSLTSSAKGAI